MKYLTLPSGLLLFYTLFISALSPVLGNETADKVLVLPNQAIIQVNGIVCSFCAYGAEKNLSKLTFLDQSQFGNDGVLIDIHSHRITLALQPDKTLNLHQVIAAITQGGYDPIKVYLNIYGQVSRNIEQYRIINPNNNQVFSLHGNNLAPLASQGLIHLQATIDAAIIPSLPTHQPLPILLTTGIR